MKQKLLKAINLPYHIANHVVGEQHTQTHRRLAGLFVMAVGVSIAHAAANANIIIALFGDLVGYTIHATGAIPYLHDIEAALKDKQDCETCKN